MDELAPEPLVAALLRLQEALAAQSFDLAGGTREAIRASRDRIRADISGHVARLSEWDAPLVVVFGGGTGGGKSTVANTLVGHVVAATGVIRPTTSSPTLLVHPDDGERFRESRLLPDLPRHFQTHPRRAGTEPQPVLHIVQSPGRTPGLAILDTPDIDSVRTDNRQLADALLDAADVWAWFVTGRNYADEEGMRYLRRAARRRTALAVVLTQVSGRDGDEVLADLRRKLAAEDLGHVDVFLVPKAQVSDERLPAPAVADLRRWLRRLAEPGERERLRRQTLDGALDDLEHELGPVLAALDGELATAERLRAAAEGAFARLPERFGAALEEGIPLRREVMARWSEFVGGDRLQRMVETASGMIRGWVRDAMATAANREQEQLGHEVRREVAGTVADLVLEAHDLAVEEAVEAWSAEAAGRRLLDARAELTARSPDLAERATAAVQAWQEEVGELIRTRGVERRVRARWLSGAVNAGATAAILVAFASTGGLTGIEAGVAAGAGAANQALLTKLLGEQNISWLVRHIREALLEHVTRIAREEAVRFTQMVESFSPDEASIAGLRTALAAIDEARR